MKMVAFSRRTGRVLKLVHPGGFAEIHQNPITAAEVMEKNPRHLVTRPDVFRFPWIVVRPESILNPGSVFFIVPYRTVHCLLKTIRGDHFLLKEEMHSMHSLDEITKDFHQLLAQQQHYPQERETRTKIDCKFEDGDEDSIFPKSLFDPNKQCCEQCCLHQQSLIEAADYHVKGKQDRDEYPKERYPLLHHWPVDVFGYKNREMCKIKMPVDPFVEPKRSSFSSQSTSSDDEFVGPLSKELSSSQEEKGLKSCLKKNHRHHAKARDFRVRFVLPVEDDKNQ